MRATHGLLQKETKKKLAYFERKILRKIYGPVYNAASGTFERRKNDEVQRLYSTPSIFKFKRLERVGHIVGKPCGKRPL